MTSGLDLETILLKTLHQTKVAVEKQSRKEKTKTALLPIISKLLKTDQMAEVASCNARSIKTIRSNLRYFGTTRSPPNDVERPRSITTTMLDALRKHLYLDEIAVSTSKWEISNKIGFNSFQSGLVCRWDWQLEYSKEKDDPSSQCLRGVRI